MVLPIKLMNSMFVIKPLQISLNSCDKWNRQLQTDLFWLEKIMEDSFPLQKVFFCYDIALMKKYVFKPYSKIFPLLFDQEKLRLASHLKGDLKIEHVGSTAVSQLEGKGIIDIAIAVDKKEMDSISKQLQELGYEF